MIAGPDDVDDQRDRQQHQRRVHQHLHLDRGPASRKVERQQRGQRVGRREQRQADLVRSCRPASPAPSSRPARGRSRARARRRCRCARSAPGRRRIASQRVAPRPYAASLILYGTAASASCETAATVGRIMIASTSAAGSMPGPLKRGAEERNPAQVVVQPVGQRPNRRDHDEDAPQAVDHARNRRQQLDDGAERPARAAAAGNPASGRSPWPRRRSRRSAAPGSSCRACPRSPAGSRTRPC